MVRGRTFLALVVAATHALESLPTFDSITMRCWQIADAPTIKQLSAIHIVNASEGLGCPFQIALDLPPTAQASQLLTVTWTISFTLDSIRQNKLGYNLPLIAVPASGQVAQIVYAALHTCQYDNLNSCDPFGDTNNDMTSSHVGNFTIDASGGGGQKTWTSTLSFSGAAGDVAVVVHAVLPGTTTTSRYDFGLVRRLHVLEVAPELMSSPSSSGESTLTVALGIGGGVLVVVLLAIVWVVRHRRRHPQPAPSVLLSSTPHHLFPGHQHAYPHQPPNHSDYSDAISKADSSGRSTMTIHSSVPPPLASSKGPSLPQSSRGGSLHDDAAGWLSLTRDDEETLAGWRLDESQVHTSALLSRGRSRTVAVGSFGQVWVGTYRGTVVAVKKLLPTRSSSPVAVRTFVAEILLMAKLESQFIVSFIGVSWYRRTEMMLVLEYMNQGDLRTMLEQTTPETFPLDAKLNCARSVAEGLVYLHTLDNSIIHRDVKSRNVLLDSHKGTKLTDFGVSREESSETMTIGIGTYRWMAPEILTDSYYTQAADIYSFGVILAELDTHLLPYSDQLSEKGKPLNDTAIMGRVMQGTIQPTFLQTCLSPLLQLAKECLSYDPEKRPKALAVAYRMREIRKSVTGTRDSVVESIDDEGRMFGFV
ncbi:Aste57867_10844 [Aphanomyces stellatus]|uniref:Aste57867_10844 protein n=1 Tax=Aphanomyces stellatus TaxID=120398 RepID=A0A485KRV3_9STRA|nr:hypothetical protein As57867_010804 [Aphanomyces stellatus]VFT87712.1 Aste57867_10844 [Aphanomyces stellatus]